MKLICIFLIMLFFLSDSLGKKPSTTYEPYFHINPTNSNEILFSFYADKKADYVIWTSTDLVNEGWSIYTNIYMHFKGDVTIPISSDDRGFVKIEQHTK